jgi:hypothetical protein
VITRLGWAKTRHQRLFAFELRRGGYAAQAGILTDVLARALPWILSGRRRPAKEACPSVRPLGCLPLHGARGNSPRRRGSDGDDLAGSARKSRSQSFQQLKFPSDRKSRFLLLALARNRARHDPRSAGVSSKDPRPMGVGVGSRSIANRSPLSGANRKTFARSEPFSF